MIADPPWVSTNEMREYPEDPLVAIDGGPDGLDVAHGCVEVASRVLIPIGLCLRKLGTIEQVEALTTYVKARDGCT